MTETTVGEICGKDEFLSQEWKREGVMDDENGNEEDDNCMCV